MKVTMTQARELLRAADPARDIAPVPQRNIEEALASLRANVHGTDATTLTMVPVPGAPARSRRIAVVVAAAASVAAIGMSVALVASRSPSTQHVAGRMSTHGSEAPTPSDSSIASAALPVPSFGPTGTLGTSDDPHFAATLARVQQALAGAPAAPQSTRSDTAPVASLRGPFNYSEDGNLIDRATFFTAPGTPEETIAYFTAHPPAGMTSSLSGSAGDVQTVGFEAPGDGSSDELDLGYAVVAITGGVAIRVDAMSIWIPSRAAGGYLGTVSSVDITVERPMLRGGAPAAPTVRRTLTGDAAQRLAHTIDALPVSTPGVSSCPNDQGFYDILVFHVADGTTIDARNAVGGCGSVALDVGRDGIDLAGSIDPQIMTALGLPADYGD